MKMKMKMRGSRPPVRLSPLATAILGIVEVRGCCLGLSPDEVLEDLDLAIKEVRTILSYMQPGSLEINFPSFTKAELEEQKEDYTRLRVGGDEDIRKIRVQEYEEAYKHALDD